MSLENKDTLDVRFANLPMGSEFKTEATGDRWIRKINDQEVQYSADHYGPMRPDTLITEHRLPSLQGEEQRMQEAVQRNREKDPSMQVPEWTLNVTAAQHRQQVANALQATPFVGPTKNSLDNPGEYKVVTWEEVPLDSFFTVSDNPGPNANVYAKNDAGHLIQSLHLH